MTKLLYKGVNLLTSVYLITTLDGYNNMGTVHTNITKIQDVVNWIFN